MKVIQTFIQNSLDNFNYIIYSEKNQKAIHVDPYDTEQTLNNPELGKVSKHYLVNTHQHPDHVRDNLGLVTKTGAEKINLSNGERFHLSDEEFIEALDTPGHTADHKCYLLYEDGSPVGIITGDVLFNAGIGHCKLGGDPEVLYESITKIIKRLPTHLKIYPGHDYMKNNLNFARTIEPDNKVIDEYYQSYKRGDILTIEDEKKYNPFLRTNTSSLQNLFPHKSDKQIFLELRSRRDKW